MNRIIPRSILYSSAANFNHLLDATRYDADLHLIDLEDSIPQSIKQRARTHCTQALEKATNLSRMAVRINPMSCIEFIKDIDALSHCPYRPGFIFMTMVRHASEPELLRTILNDVEWKPQIYITLETTQAVESVFSIAAACDGIILGSADLSAALGVDISWDALLYARQRMVAACAQYNIGCIDTGNFSLHDSEILEIESQKTKTLGFDGKGTVHPKELATINKLFRPNAKETAFSKRIIAMSEQHNGGVFMMGEDMIGPPFIKKAKQYLASTQAWNIGFNNKIQET